MADITAEAEAAADAMMAERQWPVVVTLKHPIEFGSESIKTLTFRRGRLGDLKGVSVDGMPTVDQLLKIASRMCVQPTNVLELLEDEDGSEVIMLALGFFGRSLSGGRKPSPR